jgi:hypothetical protein
VQSRITREKILHHTIPLDEIRFIFFIILSTFFIFFDCVQDHIIYLYQSHPRNIGILMRATAMAASSSSSLNAIECSDQPLDVSFHPERETIVAAALVDGTLEGT